MEKKLITSMFYSYSNITIYIYMLNKKTFSLKKELKVKPRITKTYKN